MSQQGVIVIMVGSFSVVFIQWYYENCARTEWYQVKGALCYLTTAFSVARGFGA